MHDDEYGRREDDGGRLSDGGEADDSARGMSTPAAGTVATPASVDELSPAVATPAGETPAAPDQPEQPVQATTYSVQFATPDAGAFDASLAGVRAAPGVRGTAITSTAIGGSSVMAVTFAGTLDQLAAALRARGFTVRQSGNSLAISR